MPGDTITYYCVTQGRQIGVFLDWNACERHILRFPGNVHKSFKNIDEAVKFMLAEDVYTLCKNIPNHEKEFSVKIETWTLTIHTFPFLSTG